MSTFADVHEYNEDFGDLEILEEEYDENYEPTEKDIFEQCVALGIDPFKEPDLLYIAREALMAPIPENWKPVKNARGDIFYFNIETQESTWEHPCDTYYQNLLLKEREKKKHALSFTRSDMLKTATPPLGGPVLGVKGPDGIVSPAHKAVPNLPASLHLHKPAALAPIGAPLDPIAGGGEGGRLASLGPLPPLKAMGGAKEPLPALKAPSSETMPFSSSPMTFGKTPPTGLVNTSPGLSSKPMLEAGDKGPKPPLTNTFQSLAVQKETLKPGPSDTGSGGGGKNFLKGGSGVEKSTLYVSNVKPSRPPISHTADLAVGHISTQFEEEDEDDEEEQETSDEVENSFNKKFNLMGVEDLPSEGQTSSAEVTSVEEERRTVLEQQPTHFSTSYFLKSGNQNPQQGVSSQDSSPQGSPSTRPKAARGSRTTSTTPSTAMVSHTSQEHTQQVTVSKSFSPTHVEPSSSSVKLANAKERAELERSHQETMEKLRLQHAKELEQLKSQFQQEIKYEKEELGREKKRKLSLTKEQLDAEATQEENKLRRQHEERVEATRKKIREDEEDEEALLQEKKEDALRTIKKKLSQEQEEEERTLKKSKEEHIAKLKSSIEKEKEAEEKRVRDAVRKEIDSLREKLREEKDKEMRKTREEGERGVTQQKEELRVKLEKTKNQLLEQHKKEVDKLKQSLSEEHSAKLDRLREELTGQFEKRREEIVEQKALQTAVEEEARASLESKKKELEEKQEEELSRVRKAHQEEITRLREGNRQALLTEEETGKLKLAEARENKVKELNEIRTELEREKSKLLEERKLFEESRWEFEREAEEFARMREEMEAARQTLEKEKLNVEKVENNLKYKKSTMLNTETPEEGHFPSDKKLKDELKKTRQAVEKEKKALDELKELRGALTEEMSRLQKEKHALGRVTTQASGAVTATQSRQTVVPPQAPPSSQTLISGPTYSIASNGVCGNSNLIFSNPAAANYQSPSEKTRSLPSNLDNNVSVSSTQIDDDEESETRTSLETMSSSEEDDNLTAAVRTKKEEEEVESNQEMSLHHKAGQMSTLHISDLEPSIHVSIPPRKRPGKKKTLHHRYGNGLPPKEHHHEEYTSANQLPRESNRMTALLDKKKDNSPYCKTDDVWKMVRDQIEREGIALQMLERDFTNGPVKRLEKIERMLEDMEDDKESVNTDYSIDMSHNHTHLNGSGNYASQPYLDQAKRQVLQNREMMIKEDGITKKEKDEASLSSKWCQKVLNPHTHKHTSDLSCSRGELKLRELQRNSHYLSSDSECSSPSPELRNFSPETVRILNQARSRRSDLSGRRSRNGSRHSSVDSDVSVTLEKISGQLGDVIDRLDERVGRNETPPTKFESNRLKSLGTSPNWSREKLTFDKELHDRWQAFLDNAARDEMKRRAYLSQLNRNCSPPVGRTRTDLAGQALIRKQKDWLLEFRQSIPICIRQQASMGRTSFH